MPSDVIIVNSATTVTTAAFPDNLPGVVPPHWRSIGSTLNNKAEDRRVKQNDP